MSPEDRTDAQTMSISRSEDREASAERISLVVYHRDGAEAALLTRDRPLIVGRVPPADLVVPDRSLSRQHASFRLVDHDVIVEDLGSTNGTWIEGENIERAMLAPGTVVTLGAVSAVVSSLSDRAPRGLEGHDQFALELEREVARARYFGRGLALLMVISEDAHMSAWCERVQGALRPIDRAALYSSGTLEVVLPEIDKRGAAEIAERMVAQAPGTLCCAIATYPESATQADALLEACRTVLQRGSGAVRIAEPATVVLDERVADGGDRLVAESPAMKQMLVMARRVARGVIPLLIHGETGSGKEVLCRFIHEQGPRAGKPLVAVNCAAIPPQLVESTLFGHEKGAFTGATHANKGVFEAAHEGTLLLDEIGELPAAAQAALLRVLETKKVTRVGSTKEVAIDVRIIAATHRDLEDMSRTGGFREDLLYRLNALALDLPPLRQRREDIAALAHRFLEQASRHNARDMKGFEPAALEALVRYDWPGNVRELRNAIERAAVIAEHSVVTLNDLPRRVRDSSAEARPNVGEDAAPEPQANGSPPPPELWQRGESFRACIERLEAEVIVRALQAAGGRQTEAARLLEMPRRTLVHKIKTLGIKRGNYSIEE